MRSGRHLASGHPCLWKAIGYALLVLLLVLGVVGCDLSLGSPVAFTPVPSDTAVAMLTPTFPPSSTSCPSPTRAAVATLAPTRTPNPPPSATPKPLPTLPPSPTPTPSIPEALTPQAGERLALSLGWQHAANSHLSGGRVLYVDGQLVYLVTTFGRVLNALDDAGKTLWQVNTRGPVYALEIPAGDRVAIGDDAGYVSLIHMSGRRIWSHDLGSRITELYAWQGGLLAGGWDERLTFLSLGGQVVWQAELEGSVSGITALSDVALVATQDGELTALAPSGEEAWNVDVGAPITALDSVSEGPEAMVLVGVRDGRLLALDSEGELLWQRVLGYASVGGPVWRVADVDGDAAPEISIGTGGDEPSLALLTMGGDWLWRVSAHSPVGAVIVVDMDGDGLQEILVGLADGAIQAYDGQGRLRGSTHAGLPVWGLEAAPSSGQSQSPFTVLIRADVVAWQLVAQNGPQGSPWLLPPVMVSDPPDNLQTEDTPGEATLVFLGDVSPGRTMESQLARYGPAYPWEGLYPILSEADLAVANLESVLTTQGKPLQKSYLIRAHPRWGQTLVDAGFDLVTVANNHALDFEQVGLDETLETLEALGIASVGGGRDAEEARRPAIFDVNGLQVAVLGYAAARWNGSEDVPLTDHVAWADLSAVQSDVSTVRAKADVVVVLLHAGTEYAQEPSPDQMAVARTAVNAGADLVVGHHPHVTQTVERLEDGLIVYSLGDALFDIPYLPAMQGDLLRVRINAYGLVEAELWPFWIDDSIRPRFLSNDQGEPKVETVYP